MRELVLVRHGESEWNAERRVQGQGGTGLSARGVAQAEHAARAVADAWPDARVVSSDLQRCRETAAPLLELLGADEVTDPGLRERHFGAWTGRLRTEIEREWPEHWARWRAGEDVLGELGGETDAQLGDRVEAALRRLLDAGSADRSLVCVTHGGPVWHGTHRLAGLAFGSLGGVSNACITVLAVHRHGLHLTHWNQVTHLPARLRTGRRPASRRDAPSVGR